MISFKEWSTQELLQLATIAGTVVTAILSLISVRMAKSIHIMINSRMSQMMEGARAEGGMQERAAADARNRAQEVRSDDKELTEKK